MFELFDLSYDFLDEDITLWPENQNFLENLEYFKKLQVVNDVAERGVVLIEQSGGLTVQAFHAGAMRVRGCEHEASGSIFISQFVLDQDSNRLHLLV
ncbi:hypothetical protein EVAR_49833_1 [Eumeta japonica]|uniref:Uncharacterized protein n=1 Tax=Eumeta variegata TaxID=151549 RepID=A0A4C1YX44_EUMVA|nr:hypothetical protein EVAR_49833_1 [Eumeta japonica]